MGKTGAERVREHRARKKALRDAADQQNDQKNVERHPLFVQVPLQNPLPAYLPSKVSHGESTGQNGTTASRKSVITLAVEPDDDICVKDEEIVEPTTFTQQVDTQEHDMETLENDTEKHPHFFYVDVSSLESPQQPIDTEDRMQEDSLSPVHQSLKSQCNSDDQQLNGNLKLIVVPGDAQQQNSPAEIPITNFSQRQSIIQNTTGALTASAISENTTITSRRQGKTVAERVRAYSAQLKASTEAALQDDEICVKDEEYVEPTTFPQRLHTQEDNMNDISNITIASGIQNSAIFCQTTNWHTQKNDNRYNTTSPVKTSTERTREHRARKKAMKNQHPIGTSKIRARTSAERTRAYRARKKALAKASHEPSPFLYVHVPSLRAPQRHIDNEFDMRENNTSVLRQYYTNNRNFDDEQLNVNRQLIVVQADQQNPLHQQNLPAKTATMNVVHGQTSKNTSTVLEKVAISQNTTRTWKKRAKTGAERVRAYRARLKALAEASTRASQNDDIRVVDSKNDESSFFTHQLDNRQKLMLDIVAPVDQQNPVHQQNLPAKTVTMNVAYRQPIGKNTTTVLEQVVINQNTTRTSKKRAKTGAERVRAYRARLKALAEASTSALQNDDIRVVDSKNDESSSFTHQLDNRQELMLDIVAPVDQQNLIHQLNLLPKTATTNVAHGQPIGENTTTVLEKVTISQNTTRTSKKRAKTGAERVRAYRARLKALAEASTSALQHDGIRVVDSKNDESSSFTHQLDNRQELMLDIVAPVDQQNLIHQLNLPPKTATTNDAHGQPIGKNTTTVLKKVAISQNTTRTSKKRAKTGAERVRAYRARLKALAEASTSALQNDDIRVVDSKNDESSSFTHQLDNRQELMLDIVAPVDQQNLIHQLNLPPKTATTNDAHGQPIGKNTTTVLKKVAISQNTTRTSKKRAKTGAERVRAYRARLKALAEASTSALQNDDIRVVDSKNDESSSFTHQLDNRLELMLDIVAPVDQQNLIHQLNLPPKAATTNVAHGQPIGKNTTTVLKKVAISQNTTRTSKKRAKTGAERVRAYRARLKALAEASTRASQNDDIRVVDSKNKDSSSFTHQLDNRQELMLDIVAPVDQQHPLHQLNLPPKTATTNVAHGQPISKNTTTVLEKVAISQNTARTSKKRAKTGAERVRAYRARLKALAEASTSALQDDDIRVVDSKNNESSSVTQQLDHREELMLDIVAPVDQQNPVHQLNLPAKTATPNVAHGQSISKNTTTVLEKVAISQNTTRTSKKRAKTGAERVRAYRARLKALAEASTSVLQDDGIRVVDSKNNESSSVTQQLDNREELMLDIVAPVDQQNPVHQLNLPPKTATTNVAHGQPISKNTTTVLEKVAISQNTTRTSKKRAKTGAERVRAYRARLKALAEASTRASQNDDIRVVDSKNNESSSVTQQLDNREELMLDIVAPVDQQNPVHQLNLPPKTATTNVAHGQPISKNTTTVLEKVAISQNTTRTSKKRAKTVAERVRAHRARLKALAEASTRASQNDDIRVVDSKNDESSSFTYQLDNRQKLMLDIVAPVDQQNPVHQQNLPAKTATMNVAHGQPIGKNTTVFLEKVAISQNTTRTSKKRAKTGAERVRAYRARLKALAEASTRASQNDDIRVVVSKNDESNSVTQQLDNREELVLDIVAPVDQQNPVHQLNLPPKTATTNVAHGQPISKNTTTVLEKVAISQNPTRTSKKPAKTGAERARAYRARLKALAEASTSALQDDNMRVLDSKNNESSSFTQQLDNRAELMLDISNGPTVSKINDKTSNCRTYDQCIEKQPCIESTDLRHCKKAPVKFTTNKVCRRLWFKAYLTSPSLQSQDIFKKIIPPISTENITIFNTCFASLNKNKHPKYSNNRQIIMRHHGDTVA